MDENAATLIAIISKADVLYQLKWPWTNNTNFNRYIQMDSALILSILRDKATLPARCLLHAIRRCLCFSCVLCYSSHCVWRLRNALQSKSNKFTPDIFTLRLINTLTCGPQLDNAKWLRLILLALNSHCAQIQQKASRWLVSSTAQFHNLVTTSRLISVARWTKLPIQCGRRTSHWSQLTNWNFWTIWGEESTRQQPQKEIKHWPINIL